MQAVQTQASVNYGKPVNHLRDLEALLTRTLRLEGLNGDDVSRMRQFEMRFFDARVGSRMGTLLVGAVPRSKTVLKALEETIDYFGDQLQEIGTGSRGTIMSQEFYRDAAVTGTLFVQDSRRHFRTWDNPVGLMEHFRGMEGECFVFDELALRSAVL
jgi:hypothetical protein